MTEPQIQTAIHESQMGTTSSFGLVYDAYVKKIYDYIYYRTMHQPTAEDLVSTIFIKALSNIKSYRPEAGSFQTWIYRIARNTLIDHYRTAKSTLDIDQALDVKTETDFARDVDNQQQLQEVKNYLQSISEEHRELVILRLWDELSYQEIAEITGKSEASLKMSMSRILAKLRTEIAFAFFIIINLGIWIRI